MCLRNAVDDIVDGQFRRTEGHRVRQDGGHDRSRRAYLGTVGHGSDSGSHTGTNDVVVVIIDAIVIIIIVVVTVTVIIIIIINIIAGTNHWDCRRGRSAAAAQLGHLGRCRRVYANVHIFGAVSGFARFLRNATIANSWKEKGRRIQSFVSRSSDTLKNTR